MAQSPGKRSFSAFVGVTNDGNPDSYIASPSGSPAKKAREAMAHDSNVRDDGDELSKLIDTTVAAKKQLEAMATDLKALQSETPATTTYPDHL
jgi:hypothetical protein